LQPEIKYAGGEHLRRCTEITKLNMSSACPPKRAE
jgi:hypothetical protein